MLLSSPLILAALLSASDAGAPDTRSARAESRDGAADLADDVKLLYQVVTCQDGKLPDNLDQKTIDAYCKKQKEKFARFQEHWGTHATEFITGLEPKELPPELVYPFGGGDLMMALAAFPDAKVITTLSLELAGDPRRLKTLADKKALETSLKGIAEASGTTLVSNDSKSVNLSKTQRGELPGQLSIHLMGLALFNFVPVSVKYFRIEDDGTLHYFTAAEITALEGQSAGRLKETWKSPDFSPAFANVEVQFVPKDKPDAAPRIHRHIGADLSDGGLKKAPGVLAYLKAKGDVAAMTKAASYLLWRDDFVTMRDYLVSHARFMLSDSTGVPVRWWKKAKCEVKTYGSFEKSFLGTWQGYQDELKAEFEAQGPRKLPMRFGYPDGSAEKRSHLITATCPR
jgi:hypothetical protein